MTENLSTVSLPDLPPSVQPRMTGHIGATHPCPQDDR